MPNIVDALFDRIARSAVQARMTKPVAFTARGGSAALQLSSSSTRWSSSAIAYRCIQAISTNASSLRVRVVDDEGVEQQHELTQLWQNPNPLLSSRVFGEYLWQRLETRGETFVYLDRGESGVGPIEGMWPIFGDVTVIVDKNLAGEVVGYRVDVGSQRVLLLPSEVIWLRYPDGENEWGKLAPLTAAAHAIGLDAYARAWQEGELRNGARPSSVVYLGDLDEEQHEEVVESYRNRVEGAENAGRTLFVSSAQAAKVERMSLTPAELGWLDTRRNAWEEIMLAWGVPKDYLMGGATYENRTASRATLWSDAIVPKLQLVAGELTRQIIAVDRPDWRAEFDLDDVDALQESADAKAKRTNEAVTVDVMLLDEARAEYGLDPLPNGVGQLTLSAYRTQLQLLAQQQLVDVTQSDAARQLPRMQLGPISDQSAPPQLALPARKSTRAGLSFDEAQTEYDMHEKIGAKAVKRLASKQEQIVLNNLHKLFDRGGQWKPRREALEGARDELITARLALEAAEAEGDDDDRTTARDELDAAELQLRAQIDDLLDAELARTATREQLEAFLTTVWQRGGETTAAALGVSFDAFDLDVLVAMDARLDVLAEQVTETTRRVLEDRVLLQGVANGESVPELAARVRAIYTDLSTWRATVIARTETVGGFNHASMLTAQSTGIVKSRVWLATGDTRTRDSHVMLDGVTVTGFETPYPNGCRFPGDPMGKPEETIMCRCVEIYDTAE